MIYAAIAIASSIVTLFTFAMLTVASDTDDDKEQVELAYWTFIANEGRTPTYWEFVEYINE